MAISFGQRFMFEDGPVGAALPMSWTSVSLIPDRKQNVMIDSRRTGITYLERKLNGPTKAVLPYAVIVACIGMIFFILGQVKAVRVGDGSEYYALFLAWRDGRRPWMTPETFLQYEEFYARSGIEALLSSEWLAQAFPSLRVGETADFNHFWFYSLLAVVVYQLAAVVGLTLSVHASFVLLHLITMVIAASVAYYLYRLRGVVVLFTMTFLSPILWFTNKVHVEFFTFTLSTTAVALIGKKHYLAGSFLLAIVSTQNLSFSIVAALPFAYRTIMLRRQRYSGVEILLAVTTSVVVVLHPAYFFFRYGVVTPQLYAGGASLRGGLGDFYVWLLDPDLGLLPYWPLGLVTILAGLVFIFRDGAFIFRLAHDNSFFLIFLCMFFAVNVYAHSSTTNLNSGGTSGPARYSLWYLPILFPLLVFVAKRCCLKRFPSVVAFLAVVAGGLFNFALSQPTKSESYSTPSWLSLLIQTHFSGLYSPPPEVFAERFSGEGEGVQALQPLAVVGPDCRKVLVFPELERVTILVPPECVIDEGKLQQLVSLLATSKSGSEPFYFSMSKEQREASLLTLVEGQYDVGLDGRGNFALGAGWSDPEDFGIWSDGPVVELVLPCSFSAVGVESNRMELALNLLPFGDQVISVQTSTREILVAHLSGESGLSLSLDEADCDRLAIGLTIAISNPTAPAELGVSRDVRELGVALTHFDVKYVR